ncbi:MAG: type II toxin-antitoxin system Phd/YefM family antitoxin [Pseudobdellovibrionaceae bacterium]
MKITAAKFKAQCLKLMDQVASNQNEIIITKRGKSVARLVAVKSNSSSQHSGVFGRMKNTVEILDDIVTSTGEKWSADE